jgi:hypothetical protein
MRLLIENVHITGPHVHWPNQARQRTTNPPARDQCLAKTVYVSFVITDGDSYHMKQAGPDEEDPDRQATASLKVMR